MELTAMLKMVGLTNDELVGGFVSTKKEKLYAVINRKDAEGKRKPLWIPTHLPATEGNREEAEIFCLSSRIQYTLDLKNGVAEQKHAPKRAAPSEKQSNTEICEEVPAEQKNRKSENPLFADLLKEWVDFRDPRKVSIGEDYRFDRQIVLKTWEGYRDQVEQTLYPLFKAYSYMVKDITPDILRDFYGLRLKQGLKKSTIAKHYTVINQVLNYAISKKLILVNPNTAITLGKIERYNADILNGEQMLHYLQSIVGDIIEIPILFGGFYGMRRSECVGLRESQFDFTHEFFRASHTVVKVKLDGKKVYVPSDKLKTDTSNRSYPLLPYIQKRVKAKMAENRDLREWCGNSYCKDWTGYLCVDQLGEIIDPDYITNRHGDLLKKAGLPHVRFHDLRHSCVALMMANQVPLERIKDWVGHSDIRTTVNTYGHLDWRSKKQTAQILHNSLPLDKIEAANPFN